MSHDFAKEKSAKAKRKRSPKNNKNTNSQTSAPRRVPAWLLFFSGVACTLFIQLFIHLAQIPPSNNSNATEIIKKPTQTQPKFIFYDDLKTQKVEVNPEIVDDREQGDYNYVLQAGSFKKRSDAEQRHATIAFLDLDSSIKKRKSKHGTIWYRIIVGPFTSRSRLQKARSTLISNEIKTLIIKRG